MAMMAFRPLCLSWQKATCSWPLSAVKTPMATPGVGGRALVGRRRCAGGSAGTHDPSTGTGRAPVIRSRSSHLPGSFDLPAVSCLPRPVGGRGRRRATIGPVPPFAAYFRVYEPLVAFDRARQQYWRRYVAAGGGVAQSAGPGRQRRLVLEALGA